MQKDEALQLLKLQEIPSTEQILTHFDKVKASLPHNIKELEQAKDTLLIENLRQDCMTIGNLIKNCGLELEIRVIPPYIKTKLEFEEHKRNLVVVSVAAIKDQCMGMLDELKSWDELKHHPQISSVTEYFHFENHLPKLYQEDYTNKLKNSSLNLESLTALKISLQNYKTYIFNNLKNYCLGVIEQFRQAMLCPPNQLKELEESILACESLQEIGNLSLGFIEKESHYLHQLKEDCNALEQAIKGIHTTKPSHVFSPIIHWSTYKSLLIQELKNQSMMQQFHLCKDFAKEEVSWMTFFNFICQEIKKATHLQTILKLEEHFKQAVLEYYEIKEWLRTQNFNTYLTSAFNATFGLVPPNLRILTFEWLKKQDISGNILVDMVLDKTLELSKEQLMSLPGIAIYSIQIKKTHDLHELSKIDILMKL